MNFQIFPKTKPLRFFCLIGTIIGTFFISGATYQSKIIYFVPAAKNQYKNVIFDLGGVLFTTSKQAKASIFAPTIIKNPMLLYHIVGLDIKDEMFKILHTIPAQTTYPMYNQNERMPQIMVDWMTGTPNNKIKNAVKIAIEKSNHPTAMKNLFIAISNLMFDADKLTQSQIPITAMIDLAKLLKKGGYKLYVLSNWEAESFLMLQNKYTEIFNLFDGIMISGQEKIGKPQPELYIQLLENHNLNPQQCIFIDDEFYNAQAAGKLGLMPIVHKSCGFTYQSLIKLGMIFIR